MEDTQCKGDDCMFSTCLQALSRNSDFLHMLMAVQRERGQGGVDIDQEPAAAASHPQDVSCRMT